jgi:hypothetical protein
MNNIELLKKHQPLKNLNRNSPYQIQSQTLEIVNPQKLVQVDMQKLKH